MIVDFHTHIFPPAIREKAMHKLETNSGLTPAYDGSPEALVEYGRGNGVGWSVTLPVATNPDKVESINDYAISLLNMPGIVSFGGMHHEFAGWKAELARIKAAGIRGIKLHPEYQGGVYINDGRLVDIMRECGRLGLIVSSHCGDDWAYPGCDHCAPAMIAEILPAMPETVFVASHFGSFHMANEVLDHLVGKRVWIDTSISFVEQPEQCAEITRTHHSDKLLFATDSPWADQKLAVDFIRELRLDRELTEKIYFRNAFDLLGMN